MQIRGNTLTATIYLREWLGTQPRISPQEVVNPLKARETLRKWCTERNSAKIIVLFGIAALALILLSDFLSDEKKHDDTTKSAGIYSDSGVYRAELEARLTELLAQMDGVGAVTVMVTVSGTAEQVYAEEVSSAESDKSRQSKNELVMI